MVSRKASPTTRREVVVRLKHRQSSGLYFKDGEYIADIKPDEGGRTIRKLGTDHDEALRRFDALLVETNAHENPLLVDFLTDKFLPSQAHLRSAEYTATRIAALMRFLRATYPNLRLSDVNRRHVEALRAFYPDVSPRTHNGNVQKLKQCLNYAADLGIIDTNPLARVKLLPVDNRRVRFLRMDDLVRIVRAAENTDAVDLFIVGALTGLRPSNVRLLSVDEVDGDVIRIAPDKMKNKRWGVIPISSHVQGMLAGRSASTHYFSARNRTDSPKSLNNLSRSYRSIVRRLDGLEWSSLYDLRHFFASQLAKQGATEQQIGRLLCHVGQSVTSRYVHHDIEDLRPLVERLSERFVEACAGAGVAVPLRALGATEGGAFIAV